MDRGAAAAHGGVAPSLTRFAGGPRSTTRAPESEATLTAFASLWFVPILTSVLSLACFAFAAILLVSWVNEASSAAPAPVEAPISPGARESQTFLRLPGLLAWAVVALAVVGGLVAAPRLGLWGLTFWILATVGLVIGGGVALMIDDRSASGGMLATPVLMLAIAAAQVPGFVVRGIVGDPDIRAARSHCERLAEDLARFEEAHELYDELRGPRFATEDLDLPAFLREEGVRYGERNGRFTVSFARSLAGAREVHRLDVASGEWETEVEGP